MRVALVALAALAAALALAAAPAGAQGGADLVVQDGHTGRSLLGGTWLLRVDRSDRGLARHWERERSRAGWQRMTVPNAWNAEDRSEAGFVGAPAWYRKDFRLPAAAGVTWRARFEAANYRATVWLNGRLVGAHAGAFVPFEVPLAGAVPGRVNRLVVRVENRRLPTDFPPSQFTFTEEPRGGW